MTVKHWEAGAIAHACKVYWAHQLIELFPADVPLLISALQGPSFHHSHSASIPSMSRSQKLPPVGHACGQQPAHEQIQLPGRHFCLQSPQNLKEFTYDSVEALLHGTGAK